MSDFPKSIATVNQIEPVPRRLRAVFGGETIFDTTRALYVWEHPNYPQYYIPMADVQQQFLVDEQGEHQSPRGTARVFGLRAGESTQEKAARVYGADAIEGLDGHVHFKWRALDRWYEEDEQVFVHARNPFARVDAARSTRTVRVELNGVVLAESSSPVMVFETGLPPRYYLNRTELNFEHLTSSDTVTECPYKGTTSEYWSASVGDRTIEDVAWAYDFPTRHLAPIAGLVAFYSEKVDVFVDGQRVYAD